MSEIRLSVTQAVLEHLQRTTTHIDERQIAYRVVDRDSELARTLLQTSRQNRMCVLFGGMFRLTVGDSGAIWRSHNHGNHGRAEVFDQLFALLSLHPGQELQIDATEC